MCQTTAHKNEPGSTGKSSPSEVDIPTDTTEAERKHNLRRLISSTNLPARHARFQSPTQTDHPWNDAGRDLIRQLDKGFLMLIHGKRGTGKTQLAATFIKIAVNHERRTAKYYKAMEIFLHIREAYRNKTVSEMQCINKFVKPSLLIIDAMEERGDTGWEDRMMNLIIDMRYDAEFDTLLITNETKEAFADRIGSSIVSRIHETGGVIEANWDSFRKKPVV